MARIASIEKAQFYPTPERVTESIGKILRNQINYNVDTGTIFDNCIGTGSAVAALAKALKRPDAKPWKIKGIELDEQRAEEARKNTHATGKSDIITGQMEDVYITGEAELVFCNPPYDINGATGERAELNFIREASKRAAHYLILVLKKDVFGPGAKHADALINLFNEIHFENVLALDFPEPERAAFGQFVIIAEKGYQSDDPIKISGTTDAPGDPEIYTPYHSPIFQPLQLTKPDRPRAVSIFATDPAALDNITGTPGESLELRPLLPMRTEHAALIASAGMLNGLEIEDKIIKGTTYKATHSKTRHVYDNATERDHEETLTAENYFVKLTIFDKSTGEITQTDSKEHPEEFRSLLLKYAEKFVNAARSSFPSPNTPAALNAVDFSFIRAPKRIEGRPDAMLPKQQEAAAAIVNYWKSGQKVATIVGEMSTGKTLTSIAAAFRAALNRAPHLQKVVALIPAKKDLQIKWQAEAATICREIPNFWTAAPETIADVEEAFNRPGAGLIVIRETSAKAGNPWRNITADVLPLRREIKIDRDGHKKIETIPLCPNCRAEINAAKIKANRKHNCSKCNHPLWTTAPAARGKNKFPLAKYIREHHAREYILIMDEAHNFKSGDTNRGYASQDLISGAFKAVQMTGTVFSGLASSIFYLLYRSTPGFRKLYKFREAQKFIDAYGLRQQITKTYRDQARAHNSSGYKQYKSELQERPGINPRMAALLLNNSAFIQLRDFDYTMPDYSEHILLTEPDEDLTAAYKSYINALKAEGVARWTQDKDKTVLSQWQWARFGILDRPDQPETIAGIDYEPPSDAEHQIFSKEEALIRLCAREKQRGRRVLCFIGQMQRRDPAPRLSRLLAKHGIKAATMYSNTKNRLEFIRANIKAGADVIFTSAPLVSEGVDIVETPTIIWYAHEFNTYIMPQANRRSYRLHQTKPVEIYYLAYNRTAQADAMVRIAKKIKAQQQLQGDVTSGLAKLQNEDDFIDDLQSVVSDHQHHETEIEINELPPLPPELPPEAISAKEKIFLEKVEAAKQAARKKAADKKRKVRAAQLKARAAAINAQEARSRDIDAIIKLAAARKEQAQINDLFNNPERIAAQQSTKIVECKPQKTTIETRPEVITINTYNGNLFDMMAIKSKP